MQFRTQNAAGAPAGSQMVLRWDRRGALPKRPVKVKNKALASGQRCPKGYIPDQDGLGTGQGHSSATSVSVWKGEELDSIFAYKTNISLSILICHEIIHPGFNEDLHHKTHVSTVLSTAPTN